MKNILICSYRDWALEINHNLITEFENKNISFITCKTNEEFNNYLEKSNVNPVEELILTLEHQRNYETHVKFIDLAKQMDEGGASLMRVPD